MANINAKVLRFESGAIITVEGTDPVVAANTILNTHPGSLAFTIPVREAHHFTDRGTQQQALEGDDGLGDFEIDVKCGAIGAGELVALITTNGPTSGSTMGRKAYFQWIVKIPNYRGASTGMQRTFAGFVLGEMPAYKAGTDFDTLKVKGKYTTYTEATY